jgi:hypothetical protein
VPWVQLVQNGRSVRLRRGRKDNDFEKIGKSRKALSNVGPEVYTSLSKEIRRNGKEIWGTVMVWLDWKDNVCAKFQRLTAVNQSFFQAKNYDSLTYEVPKSI